ncbi:hypothetical protein UlMin_010327 [Ulmus minor]
MKKTKMIKNKFDGLHWIYKRERIVKADYPECCSYGPVSWEDPFKWRGVIIGPPGSPYEDGVFDLSIDLPPDYPSNPPTFKFLTKIFHPNIDEDGNIYVDILEKDQWKPIHTIESLMLSITSLLTDPNPIDTRIVSCFVYRNDIFQFYKTAREWTKWYAMELVQEGSFSKSFSGLHLEENCN